MSEIPDLINCPKCNCLWDGGDIYETLLQLKKDGDSFYSKKTDEEIKEIAMCYGWYDDKDKFIKHNPWVNHNGLKPQNLARFSKVLGIEVMDKYDGISFWQCPDCKTVWDRFTNQEVLDWTSRKKSSDAP